MADLHPLAGLPLHGLAAGVEEVQLEVHLVHLPIPVVGGGVVDKRVVRVLLGVLEGLPLLASKLQHWEPRLPPVGAGGARGRDQGLYHFPFPVWVRVGAGALLQAGQAVTPVDQLLFAVVTFKCS